MKWVSLDPNWKLLPFSDESFEGIVASSVFEYFVDAQSVAAELSRVLRPEGVLLLTVPNPFNLARKIEARLQPVISSHALASLLRRIDRIRSYATYLKLSRNRFAGDCWQSMLSSAHFEPLSKSDFSKESWLHQAKTPLVLLAVKKAHSTEIPGHRTLTTDSR